jgi:hypothetical protein
MRRAITSFSLQVLTNRRYFCRLSKKRKLRVPILADRGLDAVLRRRGLARVRPAAGFQLARRGRRLDAAA